MRALRWREVYLSRLVEKAENSTQLRRLDTPRLEIDVSLLEVRRSRIGVVRVFLLEAIGIRVESITRNAAVPPPGLLSRGGRLAYVKKPCLVLGCCERPCSKWRSDRSKLRKLRGRKLALGGNEDVDRSHPRGRVFCQRKLGAVPGPRTFFHRAICMTKRRFFLARKHEKQATYLKPRLVTSHMVTSTTMSRSVNC